MQACVLTVPYRGRNEKTLYCYLRESHIRQTLNARKAIQPTIYRHQHASSVLHWSNIDSPAYDQSFSPFQARDPYFTLKGTHFAQNQIRNKSALESRGSGAAPPTLQFLEWPPTSVLDHMLILAHLPILALLSGSGYLPVLPYITDR